MSNQRIHNLQTKSEKKVEKAIENEMESLICIDELLIDKSEYQLQSIIENIKYISNLF